jgi:metal-responsive CopG/Arc/MetJ family transcriptional regulator
VLSRAEKVTVNLPAELLARIEHRRRDRETRRFEVVSESLWRRWRQAEDEERDEGYRSAHQAQRETDFEPAWAEEATKDLFGEDDTGWGDTNRAFGAAS